MLPTQYFFGLIVLLASATFPALTYADSLVDALDQYWQRHPHAQALSARADAATAARKQASGLVTGAPTLALSRLDQRGGDARETELELSLPLSTNRSDRQQQTEANQAAIQAEIASLRLSLAGELLRLNSDRLHRDEQRELASERWRASQALQREVEQMVRAGELARADLLLAQTETLAAEASQLAATQLAEDSHAQWQIRVGNLAAITDELPTPVAAANGRTHPQVLRARALAEAANANARFEQRRTGDVDVSVLMRREEDPLLAETIDSIGLRVSVPLFAGANRDQAIASAQADRLSAEAEAEQLLSSLEQEQQQARSHWQRSRQQIGIAQQQLQLTEQSWRLALAAFAAGETALSDLLRTEQRVFDSRERLSSVKQQQRDAMARLIEAEGNLP